MLRRTILGLAGAAAVAVVSGAAQSDPTSPFILRSSAPSLSNKHPLCGHSHAEAEEVYRSLDSHGCDWDALIVVDVEGLHRSHLPTFRSQLTTSPSTLLAIPHVTSTSSDDLERSAKEWTDACSAESDERKVLIHLEGQAGAELSKSIADAVSTYPSHVIIFHGTSPASPLTKRQLVPPTSDKLAEAMEEVEAEFEEEVSEAEDSSWLEEAEDMLSGWFPMTSSESHSEPDEAEEVASLLKGGAYDDVEDVEDTDTDDDNLDGYWDMVASLKSNGNGTSNSTTLPLLQRAQILSTPVITALLVSFGILIPILVMGVYALTTIQVPPYMMSIAKTGTSQQKKDQ